MSTVFQSPPNYAITTHGLSKSRQYRIWQGMKTRCNNVNEPEYYRYGGAGISYDAVWETFEGFWSDMSDGYYDGATLDRIDGSKDYTKENCRWVGYVEQNNNRKNNVKLTLNGEKVTPKDLIRITGLSQNTVYRRINDGWSAERIVSTKPITKNKHTKGR